MAGDGSYGSFGHFLTITISNIKMKTLAKWGNVLCE